MEINEQKIGVQLSVPMCSGKSHLQSPKQKACADQECKLWTAMEVQTACPDYPVILTPSVPAPTQQVLLSRIFFHRQSPLWEGFS